ncbi:alpha/beta hydrolase [Fictibacillus phosphorivorans]|uniref:alpha/beta hydrolase n=1 Tax=Fictibacillus phosphorivorans TaxID=1221500 RepID=UPI00203D0E5C|nr:alpha/beta hydrolase [Fictibacillus phosphorivorans]MCM3718144.1 alpha/beta hydrolase [Fictibacillus phosphorivorans]MCM3775771.1 alpha/beta hydrolase [Fictibacillus phosphorivorans]
MAVKSAVNLQITILLNTINKKMSELKHPPLDILTPEQSRVFYKIAREYFAPVHVDGVRVTNTNIPTSFGHDLPVRIYTPSGEGPFPVLVYFHGGGWVFGDLDSCDNVCRYFAKHAETVIVSVGYRLAPEHKYPAAFLDAVESVKWAFRHVDDLNGDLSRIAVGGESSGGNLAAAAALYLKDHREFKLSHQFLITPVLDYNFNTMSYKANYKFNLTTEKMKWFWGHYLNEPSEGEEIFASPLKADQVKGLPKTLIVTAEFDPLRDEAFTYGDRLRNENVLVEHMHYNDLVHSFINMIGTTEGAKQALDEITNLLKKMLHQ